MAKQPAFQFYPGDWIQDTRMLTPATRGVWIDMLCFMWRAYDRGTISGTVEQLARLLSCQQAEILAAIDELSTTKTADVSVTKSLHVTDCNDLVTVINRRMYREEKGRILTRSRVQKYRETSKNESCNANVTVPSSSSSSSSCTKVHKKALCVAAYDDAFQAFWSAYPKKTAKKGAWAEWKRASDAGLLPPNDALLSAVENQKRARKKALDTGQFAPEWPDPERWIKKARWEDEAESLIGKQGGNGNGNSGVSKSRYTTTTGPYRRDYGARVETELPPDVQRTIDEINRRARETAATSAPPPGPDN